MVRLLFFLFPLMAQAEYRAYELAISKDGNTQTIITNFDHYQYVGVHPLNEGETIELVDTWMCWGSQGEGIPICQNPKKPSANVGF